MEPQNINNTLVNGERVTSTYAEIYLNDTYCKTKLSKNKTISRNDKDDKEDKDEWVSPSDLLIGIVQLQPPFTSKITRGKTHEGIIAIGNAVLEKERSKFLNSLTTLLEDNDASWNYILLSEKQEVIKKVKAIFLNIYKYKSEIMKQEISNFYARTLLELEEHIRLEVHTVLQSSHANIISHFNNEIQQKLRTQKKKLHNVLTKKYITEVLKIKNYYKLLLDNELYRNSQLISKAMHERNDAVKAFYKQIQTKRLTSTMYIMSLERKKCEIKRMLLENFQTAEISKQLQKIKCKEIEIETLKLKDIRIADINKQWEEKIRKVLQLFLKFISFSLKLLPEQSTFLLDLEKMVVLQLNEIQKNPNIISSVLIEKEEQSNTFEFPQPEPKIDVCEKEPFVIVGDLSDPIPPSYGSCETLPPDVDLPFFRLGRQYTYAKCHGYESIKKFLTSQICKCNLPLIEQKTSSVLEPSIIIEPTPQTVPVLKESESSNESLVIDDFSRLHECPVRRCCNWIKRNTFPYLASYLDYNEQNYNRVTAILDQPPEKRVPPILIDQKNIANGELPFSATKQLYRTIETQYSSQEDLTLAETTCPCIDNTIVKHAESHHVIKLTSSQVLDEILLKRKLFLQRLIDKNPNLLKIFTDERFDYKF